MGKQAHSARAMFAAGQESLGLGMELAETGAGLDRPF
jgi:hypothetical protein